MSSLSISSSDSDVEWAITDFLATEPLGHYMRWEIELQRRRFAKLAAEMREAKKAYDALNKTVVLSGPEIAAHDKAFKEAQSKYTLTHGCWVCSVGHAEDMLRSAKLFDEISAMDARRAPAEEDDNYEDDDIQTFRFLREASEGSINETRNKALQAAERKFREECEDVKSDCASFYRGSFEQGRSSAMRSGIARAAKTYKEEVAAAEEAYYQACLSPARQTASGGSS